MTLSPLVFLFTLALWQTPPADGPTKTGGAAKEEDRPSLLEETKTPPAPKIDAPKPEAPKPEVIRPVERRTVASAKPRPAVDSKEGMANWLVDLARHQGHLSGRTDPRSAALHVLALLEAAAEVDADCADAYYWLYDIQQRMNQSKQAMTSLEKYCRLTPNDDAARIRLFELGLDEQQSAEKRVKFVKESLGAVPLSPAYESELRYWLARFNYERNDSTEAGKELENSLRLNPLNIQARELAYEMYGETEAELQRVEMALQLVSINPMQANVVWELGALLDRLSLHKQAQEWLNRAIAMHKASEGGKVPAEYWESLAISYLNSEDYGKAKEAADAAREADPNFMEARILKSTALAKLGKADEAKAEMDAVASQYDAKVAEVIAKKDAETAGEMAWFYAYHRPDKEKALKLAEVAIGVPNASGQAKLAYGYALHANGKTDEALKVLEPLAGTDQMAAIETAKLYLEKSRKADAVTLLTKAAGIQHSGIAFKQIEEVLEQQGEKAPAAVQQTKILAALDRFHRDVFDFPKRPGEFLKFTLRFAEEPLTALGPVTVICRMENAGPFTITFGEGYMVRPLVAMSARVGGTEEFKNYLQVLMNARAMLLPGEAMEKAVAVDVGPLREQLVRSCAGPVVVELSAMLDPVFKDGELKAGMGTIAAPVISTQRAAIDVSAEGIAGLIKQIESPDVAGRIAAAEKIRAVLAFAEHNKLKASSAKIPLIDLRAALARLVADKDWKVRAHAVTAASWSPLDGALTTAAAPAVRDENAVVKVLTVRLFATQHGEKFKAVLEQLGKTDPSHFVRMMALSFLPESTRAQASSGNEAGAP